MDNKYYQEKIIQYLPYTLMILIIIIALYIKHIALFNPTGPTVFYDELLYKEDALLIFQGKNFVTGDYPAHYPPLYSFILSGAFLFNNWYKVMIIINGILSSLLLIPVWYLAREFLSPIYSIFLVLFSALLPFQVIYPDYILSENLFLVLFIWSVLLAIRGINCNKMNAGFFGLILGAAYMTKYLMLPAIPLLIATWVIVPTTHNRHSFKNIFSRSNWQNLIIMFSIFCIIVISWAIYVFSSGVPFIYAFGLRGSVTKAIGLGISSITQSDSALVEGNLTYEVINRLLMWFSAYGAYIILAIAPLLMPLLLRLTQTRWGKPSWSNLNKEIVFFWLVFLLTLGYWFIAMRHSFGASYNNPDPFYLIGRYLMHIMPLLYIAGVIGVVNFKKIIIEKRIIVYITIFVSLIMFYGAQAVLYRQGIWNFPPWFAAIHINSPDTFVYNYNINLYIGIVCVLLTGLIVLKYFFSVGSMRVTWIIAILCIVIFWQSNIFSNAAYRSLKNDFGLHSRYIAAIHQNNKSNLDDRSLYYYIPEMTEYILFNSLSFWGVEVDFNRIHPLNGQDNIDTLDKPFLLLTKDLYKWPILLTYTVNSQEYYLYDVVNNCSSEEGCFD